MQSQQITASFRSLQTNIQVTLYYDDRQVYTSTMFKGTPGNSVVTEEFVFFPLSATPLLTRRTSGHAWEQVCALSTFRHY